MRPQAFTCGDDEARGDSQAGRAHASFGRCKQSAQNECPGWQGPAESMVAPCIKMMFDEGPGQPYSAHGHYINMTSHAYTQVACGFSTAADGSVWMVEDFF